jgi:hypothetical protein
MLNFVNLAAPAVKRKMLKYAPYAGLSMRTNTTNVLPAQRRQKIRVSDIAVNKERSV